MATITINRTPETHPLTWRVRDDNQPVWLEEYCSKVGYQAAKKALTSMTPDEVINVVKEAGLRGRGGAGFPTGVKWGLVSKDPKHTERYLLCNADEMEPGTYKDRYLMEHLPHLLIESMVISAFALGTFRGYIFIRGEYIEAAERLKQAIEEAKAQGLLGKNIFGTDFSFDLFVHTGAGRYICGEETALINSLEGRRANPRAKPPFPALVGAWGKPSCVNNVETLCNIAGIIQHGAQWYQQLSPEGEDAGTKMMGFSGRVNNPGLWELPFGVSARQILEEYAGGMQAGLTLKAWQPGGAGTAFLLEPQLDTPMSYSSISKIGARMGTGLALAIDNEVSMVGLLHNLETFFARESCGWCSPCRDGLPWSVHILAALKEGRGEAGDIAMLEHLCRSLSPGHTFCSHAPGAVEPLQSAIKNFRAEFEAGIAAQSVGNSHSINGIQPNLLNVRW